MSVLEVTKLNRLQSVCQTHFRLSWGFRSLFTGGQKKGERQTPDAQGSISSHTDFLQAKISAQCLLSIIELLWTAVKIPAIASAFLYWTISTIRHQQAHFSIKLYEKPHNSCYLQVVRYLMLSSYQKANTIVHKLRKYTDISNFCHKATRFQLRYSTSERILNSLNLNYS